MLINIKVCGHLFNNLLDVVTLLDNVQALLLTLQGVAYLDAINSIYLLCGSTLCLYVGNTCSLLFRSGHLDAVDVNLFICEVAEVCIYRFVRLNCNLVVAICLFFKACNCGVACTCKPIEQAICLAHFIITEDSAYFVCA